MTIQRFSSLSKANPFLFAEQGSIHTLLLNSTTSGLLPIRQFSYRQHLSEAAILTIDVLSGQVSLNNIRYGADSADAGSPPTVATLTLPPNQRIYLDNLRARQVYCLLEQGEIELSGWPLRATDSAQASDIEQLVLEAIGTDAQVTLLIDNQHPVKSL